MRRLDRTTAVLAGALLVLLAMGPVLPKWAVFLVTVALAKALVVLGLLVLMRAGLVSFGQGLYFALGGYAAGMAAQALGVGDAVPMLLLGTVVAAGAAGLLGLLLARYRTIFFAMLSLAFSMILYGLLVKSSALGSTDGFNVAPRTVAGLAIGRGGIYALAVVCSFAAALGLHHLFGSHLGRLAPAIRDTELRVEYMGASVRNVVHLYLVLAAALAGLGGGITALAVGHIDPEMAYWTTSGEFVFVAIFGGTGSPVAPFLASLLYELIRSYAYEYSPNTWQMVVGVSMLLVILFLPGGLWSAFARRRRAA